MNVYDFDGTIYNGDSTIDFWRFCFARHPAIVRTLPKVFIRGIQYKLFGGELEVFKSEFFSFLTLIPNLEAEVSLFWDKHQNKIVAWYLAQKKEDDVIVSASPDFLLKECCGRLGVRLIATSVDEKTGKLQSKNCKGEEKVYRFREAYPDAMMEKFYSDSYSDAPMATQAEKRFFVKGRNVIPWER